jgi:hypothetical protein
MAFRIISEKGYQSKKLSNVNPQNVLALDSVWQFVGGLPFIPMSGMPLFSTFQTSPAEFVRAYFGCLEFEPSTTACWSLPDLLRRFRRDCPGTKVSAEDFTRYVEQIFRVGDGWVWAVPRWCPFDLSNPPPESEVESPRAPGRPPKLGKTRQLVVNVPSEVYEGLLRQVGTLSDVVREILMAGLEARLEK